MTLAQAAIVDYWDEPSREAHMQHEHAPAWKAMIRALGDHVLDHADILDFGCNQGGFLRLLCDLKSIRSGVGVDIARESVAEANRAKDMRPVRYETADWLDGQNELFDIAFSHEVVYLLPDLAAHAAEIRRLLRQGGAYYLAIGAHADNPLWPRWRATVAEFSAAPPQDYTLQDIAAAFQQGGFSVAVQRLACEGFFDYDALDNRYLKSPQELVDFMTRDMMLFRMTKI